MVCRLTVSSMVATSESLKDTGSAALASVPMPLLMLLLMPLILPPMPPLMLPLMLLPMLLMEEELVISRSSSFSRVMRLSSGLSTTTSTSS